MILFMLLIRHFLSTVSLKPIQARSSSHSNAAVPQTSIAPADEAHAGSEIRVDTELANGDAFSWNRMSQESCVA